MNPRIATERIVLTAWVGCMWTVGFVVAPLLFHVLTDNRVLAGDIAGRLFVIVNYVGLGAGVGLLVLCASGPGHGFWRRWQTWALFIMLGFIVIGQWLLAPMMQSLRDAAHGVDIEQTPFYGRFALLHAVSGSLYIVNSLLGLALVVGGLPADSRASRAG
jgi:hypothetical protein